MFWVKNRAKCLNCDDIILSDLNDSAKWVSCTCGSLKIRGGRFFLERDGKNFKEMSEAKIPDEIKPTINEEVDTRQPPPAPPFRFN